MSTSLNPFAKFKTSATGSVQNKLDPINRYRKVLAKEVTRQAGSLKSTDPTAALTGRSIWYTQTSTGYETPIKYCKKPLTLYADQTVLVVNSREELIEAYQEVIRSINSGYFDKQLVEFAAATTKSIRKLAA